MEVLNSGRLGLASGCVGLCKRVIKMAVERCQERRAFGRPIGEFGLIKDKIATMMAETWALECMTYLTTGHGRRAGSTTSRSRAPSARSTAARRAGAWSTRRCRSPRASATWPSYPYERLLRDARINLIFEGTNEILRAFIALVGHAGAGARARDVARAMREPIKGFGLLSDFAIRQARTVLGRERLTRHHPLLNREAVVFEEYVQELGERRRQGAAQARAGHRRDAVHAEAHRPTWRSTSTPSRRASRGRPGPSSGAAKRARGARST